jgi:predicted DCC family thiol-disulfide oxidoreductase YuxK
MNDAAVMNDAPVILYDGVCNLCNRSVQWVIRRDRRKVFRFAAVQSAVARELLARAGYQGTLPDSVVLIHQGRVMTESAVAVAIARLLGWPWQALGVFVLVPPVLRNWLYRQVAKRRYAWFGKQDSCMMPTPELRERFLDLSER